MLRVRLLVVRLDRPGNQAESPQLEDMPTMGECLLVRSNNTRILCDHAKVS